MNKVKIVICGGHLSPALAVIEELVKRGNFDIYYFGRLHSLEGDKALALEVKIIGGLNIPYFTLTTGRLERHFGRTMFTSLFKVPIGLFQSIYHLFKIKPNFVLSFGGYVALPVCFAAWLMRIPIITHEQTSVLGLSNKIISRFAKILCLARDDTKNIPRKVKTLVTGNPIRVSVTKPQNSFKEFGNKRLPLILVTGGSLGSMSINSEMGKIIPQLVKKFRIIHQCGSSKNDNDYKYLINMKNSLPDEIKMNYLLVKHIEPNQIGDILRKSSLVIGRAGANTVTEIASVGVPAILIPLPWSGGNEQELNASFLEKEGLVKVIKQENLNSNSLLDTVNDFFANIDFYKNNADRVRSFFPIDAAEKIVNLIE